MEDINSKLKIEVPTYNIKYIYLDVQGFTNQRSVEVQKFLVEMLTHHVRESVDHWLPEGGRVIYIPTGDGICICLIHVESPFDLQMKISLDLLQRLEKHNKTYMVKELQIKVRIGLNINNDYLIKDINDHENIAGSGINDAARIMDLADGNQIMMSYSVYDLFQTHQKYLGKFKKWIAILKHSKEINVYQYLGEEEWINKETPKFFIKEKVDNKLNDLTKFYIASSIIHFKDLIEMKNEVSYGATIFLYFKALDLLEKMNTTKYERPYLRTYSEGSLNIEDQIRWYLNLEDNLKLEIFELIRFSYLENYHHLFHDSFFLYPKPEATIFLQQKDSVLYSKLELNGYKILLENTDLI